MADNSGPGIITIALGVAFGLILASEEGVFDHHANVNLANKAPAAVTEQAPQPVKTPVITPP